MDNLFNTLLVIEDPDPLTDEQLQAVLDSFDSYKLHIVDYLKDFYKNAGIDQYVTYIKMPYEDIFLIKANDRQFDVKDIMFNHSRPVYYPNKILEYALGRELTYNLSEQIYKPYAKIDSWEDYEKGYVKEQVKDLVLRGIYYSLEHNFSFSDLKKYCGYTGVVIDDEDLFSNEDFLRIISDENEFMVISRYLATPRIQEKVAKDLNQLVASLCTGCCVTKYNALNNTCNSIAIRLVDVGGKFNEKKEMTRKIFGKLVLKAKAVNFTDGIIIETKNPSINLPYKIYEFRHEFDAALAGAEPLFGYTAVDLYKRRGIRLGWDKILLGENENGTPLFAGANRINGELPIQAEHFVHNMMAGSRSGKGVMTSVIPVNAQSTGTTDTNFTATDEMLSKPKVYSLIVSDNFYEEDGTTLIKSEVREQKKVTQGTTYSYSPLEFKGYVSVDKEIQSGVVDNDVSIIFNYYKEADEPVIESKKYMITVVDELYSSSGEFIESKVRCIDTYEANSNYKYEALEYDGYKVIDVYSVNGVVKDNATITFKYKQEEVIEEIEKAYILRVRDIYYNEDGSLIRDETRLVQTDLKAGYKYKFEALKITDSYKVYHSNYKDNKYEEELVTYNYYKVVGKSIIDGKLSGDTDIVFQYIKCDLEGKAPDGVVDLPIPDNKPLKDTVISGDQPQTDDNTNIAVLIGVMCISLGSLLILMKKKIK